MRTTEGSERSRHRRHLLVVSEDGVAVDYREDHHPVGAALETACRNAGFAPAVAFAANDYREAQAMVAEDSASRRIPLAHRPPRWFMRPTGGAGLESIAPSYEIAREFHVAITASRVSAQVVKGHVPPYQTRGCAVGTTARLHGHGEAVGWAGQWFNP
jgi:hypothetical protein